MRTLTTTLRSLTFLASLALSATATAYGDYADIGANNGVDAAWSNLRESDGSGGHYHTQVLRFTNHNGYRVELDYRATLVCADGFEYNLWQGSDTLGPRQSKGGELSGHWSRGCEGHGDEGRAHAIHLRWTVKGD